MVYCNIKRGVLSVKALEGADKGRVVAHVERLLMKDVEFRVSQAGRERVVKTQRKSVHAGAVGEIEALWGATLRGEIANSTIKGIGVGRPFTAFDGPQLYYNPHKTKTFVEMSDRTPVTGADRLLLDGCKVFGEGLRK
jgi:hypothetical protein